ncbi:MAG: histidine kinase, partial [Bosea sp. (in: a-proteobacteria)]
VSAPKVADPARKRGFIVAGGVALGVAAIAGAAIYMNKIAPPEPVARNGTEIARPATPPVENGPKNSERVGSEGTTTPAAPVTPRSTPSTNPAPAPRNEIAVAQRAVLYVEGADAASQPKAVNGRVFWRLDSEAAGVGRPVETIVRATVEVPDAGLTLDFTLRRNTDQAFPASHLIGLRFSRSGDDGNGAVKETGVPQFKNDENERGAPISAIASTLGDNLFVSALSGVPVEIERNLDLILRRNWVDVPVRFASGKRGILAFEKGLSGAQTLEDAVGRWR